MRCFVILLGPINLQSDPIKETFLFKQVNKLNNSVVSLYNVSCCPNEGFFKSDRCEDNCFAFLYISTKSIVSTVRASYNLLVTCHVVESFEMVNKSIKL